MEKIMIIKLNCLMVFMALSQLLYSQDRIVKLDTVSEQPRFDKEVPLPFNSITSRKTTGSVITIDVEEELKRDQNTSIAGILNGKAPGLFGNFNTWGTGNAVLLVDGIRQDQFYINSLDPLEVASIAILKDALSKALYGAQGDPGVILITTKRGKVGAPKLRIAGQYSAAVPRALPEFLNAADYMEKYNEAQLNDGVDLSSLRYSQEAIDATRSGNYPARYPDNDFFSDRYLKDFSNGSNVFADIAGGSENIQYYVNTSWDRSNGWLNTPQGDITNRLAFRGNLDFSINEYLTMGIFTNGNVSFNKQPNAPNIWNIAATELPNNYPVLWHPNIIINDDLRDYIFSNANLEDGQLLGGNTSFLNNVYGLFTQNGKQKIMERGVQFSGKLDMDMRFITEGLSASLYGGMNFFNTLFANQNPQFAVYEPVFDENTGVFDTLYVHGVDKTSTNYVTRNNNSDFFRQQSYYATLNYNRSFSEHDISATALVNSDIFSLNDQIQNDVLFHTGVTANYMFSDKYIAEFAIMGIGSRKLEKGKRIEIAPSVGLGWVLSEEDFLSEVPAIDYLKIRSSFGISKNDHWEDYYLYKSTFTTGGWFNYRNGGYRNVATSYASVPNNIHLQKRRDFSVGLDAQLFDKAFNVQAGYFTSASLDNITRMLSTYPETLGFERLVYNNYDSDITRGLDVGMNYTFHFSNDFSLTAGSNLLYISPKITKREEPFYEGEDAALLREGTAADAMWGLLSDGLYSESDFNPDGSLVDGLPEPTFGAVQPGDIKYLDQNSDGIIDNNDQRIIGHGVRTQYSFYLDINWKDFEFYVLGIGRAGDYNYRSGDYYRVFGNVKYSVMVNEAYGPGNKDVNASHPRLSTSNVSNNNRNSDYWIYKNDSFIIPTMQLTYHFSGATPTSILDSSRIYFRANNPFVFGKNKEYTEVNPGGAPATRGFVIGIVTSF